jgi:outer membrane protein assembly factor BamB
MRNRTCMFVLALIFAFNLIPPGTSAVSDNCDDCIDVKPSDPCGWPMYRHDLCNTASTDAECAPVCIEKGLKERWRFTLPANQEINSPPSIDYGRAFFGTCKGLLYGIDANWGFPPPNPIPGNYKPLWVANLYGGIYNSPCIWNEMVYIGTDKGFIYCYSIYGALVWYKFIGTPIRCSPKVYCDFILGSSGKYYLVFGDDDGRLWCLDPMTGKFRSNWGNSGDFKSYFDTHSEKPIRSSPLVEGDNIYFYCRDMNVYSVSKDSGTKLWNCYITSITTELPDDEVVCTAKNTTDGRYIIISSVSGLVYIHDYIDIGLIEETIDPGKSLFPKTNPAINKDFLFAGFKLDAMAQMYHYPPIRNNYFFNAHLYPQLHKANSSPSVSSDNDIFFTTFDNRINWMRDIPGSNYYFRSKPVLTPYPNEKLTSIAIAYKKVYFASTSCTVHCYECSTNNDPPQKEKDKIPPPCKGCP